MIVGGSRIVGRIVGSDPLECPVLAGKLDRSLQYKDRYPCDYRQGSQNTWAGIDIWKKEQCTPLNQTLLFRFLLYCVVLNLLLDIQDGRFVWLERREKGGRGTCFASECNSFLWVGTGSEFFHFYLVYCLAVMITWELLQICKNIYGSR